MDPRVPRLRGVFHQYAFFAALVLGIALAVSADGVLERVAAWVYAAALAAMFGASALYHRVPWRTAAARLRARRLDHAMIFVFIAGTYTPFALLAFGGALRVAVLVSVWVGALLGLGLELAWIHAPRWVSATAYLVVGWAGAILVPQLFPAVGVTAGALAVAGAALYTLGAVAYATGRPDPFPATFGFHEVFHVLVVVAAATQFAAVSLVVL